MNDSRGRRLFKFWIWKGPLIRPFNKPALVRWLVNKKSPYYYTSPHDPWERTLFTWLMWRGPLFPFVWFGLGSVLVWLGFAGLFWVLAVVTGLWLASKSLRDTIRYYRGPFYASSADVNNFLKTAREVHSPQEGSQPTPRATKRVSESNRLSNELLA